MPWLFRRRTVRRAARASGQDWARVPALSPVVAPHAPVLSPLLTKPQVAGTDDLLARIDNGADRGGESVGGVVTGVVRRRSPEGPPLRSDGRRGFRLWRGSAVSAPTVAEPTYDETDRPALGEEDQPAYGTVGQLAPDGDPDTAYNAGEESVGELRLEAVVVAEPVGTAPGIMSGVGAVGQRSVVRGDVPGPDDEPPLPAEVRELGRRVVRAVERPRTESLPLTTVSAGSVGLPKDQAEPFRSIGQFERMLAEYEASDPIGIAALAGLSSVAAAPPDPVTTSPVLPQPAAFRERPSLAESRRRGLRAASVAPAAAPAAEPAPDDPSDDVREPATRTSVREPVTRTPEPDTRPDAESYAWPDSELNAQPDIGSATGSASDANADSNTEYELGPDPESATESATESGAESEVEPGAEFNGALGSGPDPAPDVQRFAPGAWPDAGPEFEAGFGLAPAVGATTPATATTAGTTTATTTATAPGTGTGTGAGIGTGVGVGIGANTGAGDEVRPTTGVYSALGTSDGAVLTSGLPGAGRVGAPSDLAVQIGVRTVVSGSYRFRAAAPASGAPLVRAAPGTGAPARRQSVLPWRSASSQTVPAISSSGMARWPSSVETRPAGWGAGRDQLVHRPVVNPMADASTPNATDEIELWSLDSEVAAALPAPGLGAAEGTGYAEQSAADLTAEPASGGEAAAVGLPYPFALPDAGMPVAMDTTETLPGIMPGQTGLPAAWGNVVERLAQVEVKVQEADEAIADEHERGPERLLAVLTDPGLAGRIAERLYPALRRRLRGELLIDRERRGALADLR